MAIKKLYFIFAFFALTGCTSTDDDIIGEAQSVKAEIGAYTDECKWVYRQMNRHYLWREDMPDSTSCDYTIDPVTFFNRLLSSKDRFSYCERNINYTGPQEIGKNNEDDFGFIVTRSSSNSVLLDTIYTIKDTKVGYFCYLKFEDTTELAPVIKRFLEANIDELVIDLRYNPGGYVSTCKYLCNSVVHESAYGKVFQSQGFNNLLSEELFKQSGSRLENEYFDFPSNAGEKQLGTPLYGLNMYKVYVLTSNRTASASEALIVCLKPYSEVVVIGERTVGKGVGSYTIKDYKYKYELHPITLRYYNAETESTPDDGIIPDYEVSGGYNTRKKDIGNIGEPLLKMAFKLIFEEI